ncbi:MAG TPA: hypothetical protein V6D37_12550 [Candidatus Sericytochromatia bacterium]
MWSRVLREWHYCSTAEITHQSRTPLGSPCTSTQIGDAIAFNAVALAKRAEG